MSAGWVLLVLFVSLLALLAIPVDLEVFLHRRPGHQEDSFTLVWLFGAVKIPVPLWGRIKRKPRKLTQHDRGGAHRALAILQTEMPWGRLLVLVRALLRRTRVRDLRLAVRFGLDDPADTGRLWAWAGPLAAALALPPVARLAIEPDFASEIFEIDGQARVCIIPIQWLSAILVFLLSPQTLRALRGLKARHM